MTITTGLRAAKKEQAAARKPAATNPVAKKAPAAKAKAEKPAAEKKTYSAQGRSGQRVYGQFAATMTHAIDVADPKSEKVLPRTGQIWQFFIAPRRPKRQPRGSGARVTTWL